MSSKCRYCCPLLPFSNFLIKPISLDIGLLGTFVVLLGVLFCFCYLLNSIKSCFGTSSYFFIKFGIVFQLI